MSEILCYMPTYSPNTEASPDWSRPYTRLKQEEIAGRINGLMVHSRTKPWVYMDVIDSVMNIRPDMELVVADGRSTDSVRAELQKHQEATGDYYLALHSKKMSQWALFNDVYYRHAKEDTKYFVYTSSDIIWTMDWVAEAIKEFDKDPSLMIIFPRVSSGDPTLPVQVASGPEDLDLLDPAGYMDCEGMKAARAPCLNMYAAIFRMDFLKAYGGYMTAYANCFSESFLYYQCEAMGGKMRLMPRGWCYHHSSLDIHGFDTEAGGYNYFLERPKFGPMMDEVQNTRSAGLMSVDYLRSVLYV